LSQIAAKPPVRRKTHAPPLSKTAFGDIQSLSLPDFGIMGRKKAGRRRSDRRSKRSRLGLTGSMGVLPRPYTELVCSEFRKGDFALRDFLDIFQSPVKSRFPRGRVKISDLFNHEGKQPFCEQARKRKSNKKLRAVVWKNGPGSTCSPRLGRCQRRRNTWTLAKKVPSEPDSVPRHRNS